MNPLTKKKTILCFFPQVNGHGGIPRFNRNLIHSLNQAYDVKIFSLNDKSKGGIHGFDRNKKKFLLAFIKSVLSKPHLMILGHLNFITLTPFSWLLGIKTVIILHGYEAWQVSKSKKIFSRFPSKYWAVSHYTKNRFVKSTKTNPLRVEKIFNTLPKEWEKSDKEITYNKFFLSVTRLDKEEGYKGIEETIKAISSIQDYIRANGWKYVIVAKGDDVKRHVELSGDLALEDLVEFRESLSDHELEELYSQCGFFTMPSTGEGFGIVFLEAMSFKKACIGAKNCGSEDVIVHEETGHLINRNETEISKSIKFFIDNPWAVKSHGEAGYKKLLNDFQFGHFQKRIEQCAE